MTPLWETDSQNQGSIMPGGPSTLSQTSSNGLPAGFNSLSFNDWYGGADKYFGSQLKDLGWKGSVFDNSSMWGNPETGVGGSGELGVNKDFLAWADKMGLSMLNQRSGNDSLVRLMQGDNMLGEAKFQVNNTLDKLADKGVPLAIALGLGGMGSGIMNSIGAGAAGAASTGVPFELGNMGAVGGSGASAAGGGMLLGGAMPEVGAGLATAGGGTLLGAGGTLGSLGGSVAGSALSGAGGKTLADIIKGATGGGGAGNSSGAGGTNYGNLLGYLSQMYAGNKQRDSIMDLYKSLDSSFAPGSAYEKTLRQELDRRDAASGRRSQYGPREVELQAKLAQQRGSQATTLAGLLDKSNAGMTDMLRAGNYFSNETGLTDLFGGLIKSGGKAIIEGVTDSDWWKDLFGGD